MSKMGECRRCKGHKFLIDNIYCEYCKTILYQDKIDKQINRKLAKLHNTQEYGLGLVKAVADPQCWCSTHKNCFRATFPNKDGKGGERPEHILAKFLRWTHHRRLGRPVFCELILKEHKGKNMGRPDLTIVDKGHVFSEEIVCTEKETSIESKRDKYPWPIKKLLAKEVIEKMSDTYEMMEKEITRLSKQEGNKDDKIMTFEEAEQDYEKKNQKKEVNTDE